MNPDSSPEAIRFRGKTLTPESPVPLHIPEPSHIPVLQNQIDPVFNLMSTHIEQAVSGGGKEVSKSQYNFSVPDQVATETSKVENEVVNNGHTPQGHDSDHGDKDYVLAFDNEDLGEEQDTDTFSNHSPSSAAQSSAFIPAHETLSPPLRDGALQRAFTQGQNSLSESLTFISGPSRLSQAPSTTQDQDPGHMQTAFETADDQMQEDGVNYQTLLDNLSPSTATAPTTEVPSSLPAAAASTASNAPRPSSAESPISALPIPPGLPPRPPPQDKPAIHPHYTTGEDIRSYHYPHNSNSNSTTQTSSIPQTSSNNSYRPAQGYGHPPPPNASIGSNGLPPPPLATFQQPPAQANQPPQASSGLTQSGQPDDPGTTSNASVTVTEEGESRAPWPPEVQRLYTEFLHDEAIYVAEGTWDKFPPGSRLFVGNLYSEKVRKEDLFFVFHKYGRLAQISIKNAYGFIQYYDANCSNRALNGEQSSTICGRKIHLEISKPQKNSRNAAATTAGNNLRAGHSRRSRSPDYDRGGTRGSTQRLSIDRGASYSNFSGEIRRRDDYRPIRSPSPRGFRGRDEYRGRDRSPDRYYGGRHSRSRSPYARSGRYRSRSPLGARDLDDEANLPIPRRDPRNVPEVQMILVDEVDRTFVAYIEKTFRDRGLTCTVFQLPRVSLVAVIKRQILEGVLAVVKIFRQSQVTGKIPLQVFDRSAGAENVRFEEYDELDAHIAAELVVRAKAARQAPPLMQQPMAPTYGTPQYGRPPQPMPPQQPQPVGGAPNIANLITSLDGPALQKLLGAMAQSPQTPQNPQHPPQMADLSAILGNQQAQPQHGYPQYAQGGPPQNQPQSPYGAPSNDQSFASNPALASLLANVSNRPPLQQGMPPSNPAQPGQPQNVQNIMDQLARWKQ